VAENDPLKRQAFHSASKVLADPYSKVDTTKDPYNKSFENTRYNKPLVTPVHVSSMDRDVIQHPQPNDYRIFLPRVFRNVKQIRLLSTEIPNTDQVVRDDPAEVKKARNQRKYKCGELLNVANKYIYWINAEDAIEPGGAANYDCVIYKACITPGNYVSITCDCSELRTIQDEIKNQISGINTFIASVPHEWIVDVDTQTNIVRILSIDSVSLQVNPLMTQAATNIITVIHQNHGFSSGEIVTILGSESVGGIPASALNGEHSITVIDSDTYTFRVSAIASFTDTGGGGNVTAGKDRPFQLLFSNKDTVGEILGFPQQDSSEPLAQPIKFIDCAPPDLSLASYSGDCSSIADLSLEFEPTSPGAMDAWICSPGHDLVPGDEILIRDTEAIPDINGLQVVKRKSNNDKRN
jgi:hypothetical protein